MDLVRPVDAGLCSRVLSWDTQGKKTISRDKKFKTAVREREKELKDRVRAFV
jgi:hypothetical protein